MNINHVDDYAKARRAAYPDVGDQLDAIWRILQAVPEAKAALDAETIFARIKQVKNGIPKP